MTDRLQNAIREAAWVAVGKQHSKAAFVAMVTKAANEAFDAHVHAAQVHSAQARLMYRTLADALEKMPK
jgi:hypothetical protein